MKLTLLFISLVLMFNASSQEENEMLLNKGIASLNEGNTLSSFKIFKELCEKDANNSSYKGYLSYSYTKLALFQDSISENDIKEAKSLSKDAYKADSNNYINKFAYVNTLYLITKHSKSNREKTNLLIEIKKRLDTLINSKEINADAYNLLAIWHRIVSNFDELELEMMKTFYKNVPTGASLEQAFKMHKKAFNISERTEYKYELAVTYKTLGLDDFYINTLNEGAAIHGDSSDDILFQKKCEQNLPQLAD